MMKESYSLIDRLLRFCLEKKLVVGLLLIGIIGWGISVAPFSWDVGNLPRSPVPVDAVPDIGENQQIVFTEWMGRSPQDVEDQITYPLTVALLGVPGVKTVRSYSFFGFSTIYIIFEEDIEFYWSRSRVLEKLNSLPQGTVPAEVQPALGPDATALGQVYWYTLEGLDPDGNPTGGWGLEELRSIQDWYVRYALLAAKGISEVGSIGGYVQEYQIDVDPDAMRAHGVTLNEIFMATRASNLDVGARTIEVNGAEYVIRGLGFIENIEDIESIAVGVQDNVPIRMRDVANVTKGPALRRGALDKGGAEAVGGVVVVRYGFNPLEAIQNTKDKIAEISPGLPAKAIINYRETSRDTLRAFAAREGINAFIGNELDQDNWTAWLRANPQSSWPEGVTLSQVSIVPFYDRTGLIYETLGTLNDALTEEIFITMIVILVMVLHLRSSILISALLPVAVLMTFIAMKLFGVSANIVALSGIAIAIGTMVDMGVIICENILRHMDESDDEEPKLEVIFRATREVAGAVLTSVATTVVSFLPVFTMTGAEGKLFTPLAFTKTFALISAVIVALAIIPPAAQILFSAKINSARLKLLFHVGLVIAGLVIAVMMSTLAGLLLAGFALMQLFAKRLPPWFGASAPALASLLVAGLVAILLADAWMPLGPGRHTLINVVFVFLLVGGLLVSFIAYQRVYPRLLAFFLERKAMFLSVPVLIMLTGVIAWMGFDNLLRFAPDALRQSAAWQSVDRTFPGLGKEFMPNLDEGSFLYMPTIMPHASIGEAQDALQILDESIESIPEIRSVVGKLGRADTPLDPAPISMFETVINYHPEYQTDANGRVLRFAYDDETDAFERDARGELIPEKNGQPFRNWRDHISSTDDIWREIVEAADLPGTTSAPKLQPIAARIVMLQSGMRAPMGIKVKGPSLESIEDVALQLESLLKQVPSIEGGTVTADRLVGKPYLEIDLDRDALARYGLHIEDAQQVIEVAVGGKRITSTIEGRERYPVRVRYFRELRDTPEGLEEILVPTPAGAQIPLGQLAEIRYIRGPQAIKSEDTFLVGYVVFDKRAEAAEVDVVEDAQAFLRAKLDSGEFSLPAGVSYTFAGNYENQLRAQQTLSVVLPIALLVIFLILYLQFASVTTTLIVFSGIAVAWAGGFLVIWMYGTSGFLDFSVLGANLGELFQVGPINMSVAIWVGFLALFGIATDNGVVTATYLDQTLAKTRSNSTADIRRLVVTGATRRIRPALMTTATTLIALIPVLTSDGRGSDIMVPMAIPSFGGMLVAVITTLLVPVLYCAAKEYVARAKT
ncbi:efflux RND transporter permease subunit [Congregibacter litoralis]|uniref:Putative silver efflux pump n=1 Tax=Congregibacter litoralis KT71 TaxID=314285 RepID=A4A7T7_9GAMM|nr:efflux RND transporter permease subunit [Congregibacter litoralis]EAQ97732.2 putative silver efflux pump [Congregibacter litoralis KT71]